MVLALNSSTSSEQTYLSPILKYIRNVINTDAICPLFCSGSTGNPLSPCKHHELRSPDIMLSVAAALTLPTGFLGTWPLVQPQLWSHLKSSVQWQELSRLLLLSSWPFAMSVQPHPLMNHAPKHEVDCCNPGCRVQTALSLKIPVPQLGVSHNRTLTVWESGYARLD